MLARGNRTTSRCSCPKWTIALLAASLCWGCFSRPPTALPEPATVREPGQMGGKLVTSMAYAPEPNGSNAAAQSDDVGWNLAGLIFNAQGAFAVGVVPGCEMSPSIGPPLLMSLDLGIKCQITPTHQRTAVALGVGGRSYALPGLFKNVAARTGIYTSYRDDTAIYMLGAHLAYGEQIYFADQGSGEWHDEYSIYAGRELRLAVPMGLSPLARRHRGFLWTVGVVFTGVLDHGSALRYHKVYDDPRPTNRREFNAPLEFSAVLQLEWGRPQVDRMAPKTH
jgi:hypothetical protein